MADPIPLTIARIAAGGDGVADTDAGPLYVPFALPGETWGGTPPHLLAPAPDVARRMPDCRHFTRCGGCVAQHMPVAIYRDWKRSLVVQALAHRGIAAEVAPLVTLPPGTRRRAVLTVRRTGGQLMAGYHEEGSHRLVNMDECPVLSPRIVQALPGIRAIAARALGGDGTLRVQVLVLETGLDLVLETARRPFAAGDRLALAELARTHAIQRLTIDGEIVAQLGAVEIVISGQRVMPPAGVFVQASSEAEAVMAEAVLAATGKAKRVADLFCGIGPFSLRLARTAQVTAVDSDAAALAALALATRAARGLKPVTTLTRDLFRDPMSRRELAPFDAVVFDPPRAGAKAQVEVLAKSDTQLIVALSCNPATFARDASTLTAGGYMLGLVRPIDQFIWSAHVEIAATFTKK